MTIIEKLIKYGYLSAGEYEGLDDSRVVDAIERYRDFLQVHTLDNESLFNLDRCGEPDIVDPETLGSGSWPKGCHKDEWPNNHAFAIYFDMSNFPKHWGPAFEQAFALVQAAYANIGIAFFRTMDRKKANTIVTWQRGQGWIGLAIVPRNPQCGQQIWAKFDNRYGLSFSLQQLIYQLAYLMAHEWGHNMGMSHTRGGIMSPKLVNGIFHEDQWRRNDPAFNQYLKRFFDGEPIQIAVPIWGIPQPEQPRE